MSTIYEDTSLADSRGATVDAAFVTATPASELSSLRLTIEPAERGGPAHVTFESARGLRIFARSLLVWADTLAELDGEKRKRGRR